MAKRPASALSRHRSASAARVEENPAPLQPIKLSVIVPMFNEEENVEHTVAALAKAMRLFTRGPWEIVLVNDGSSDETWKKSRRLAAQKGNEFLRVVGYPRNRGRGFALRTGFAAARGEWICSIDADLSYDPAKILEMVDVLYAEPDVDLVLASAYMPGGQAIDVPLDRLLVSRWGNRILSWFMAPGGRKLYTITCVFRAYRRQVLDSLDLESDGKDIHLEILSKALMLGFNYKEIPATLKGRKHGASKHKFKGTAASHLTFALFERPIIIFGMFGVIALMLAMTIFCYLFWGLITRGYWNNDRPLMSMMIVLFLGAFQLISFGILGSQFVNLRKEMIKVQSHLRKLTRGE